MFQIDPAPLQAAFNSAKANLAKAEAGLKQSRAKADRYKAVVEYNAISKQAYDDAVGDALQGEAAVLMGKSAVETARMGAVGYLAKPFTPEEIRGAADNAVRLAA